MVFGQVDNMIVRNVVSVKDVDTPRSGKVIRVANTGHIDNLIAHSVFSVGNEKVLDGEERVEEYFYADVIEK